MSITMKGILGRRSQTEGISQIQEKLTEGILRPLNHFLSEEEEGV